MAKNPYLILRAVFIGVISFGLILLTTFGWHIFGPEPEFTLKNEALPNKLKKHVIELSDKIGNRSVFQYSNLDKAAAYIIKEFEALDFKVELQKYSSYGKKVKNIIAQKTGEKKPDEIIVVGAHYDTCFNPGANDNASGVAGLIELARLLKNQKTNRTIKFIAFTNEEPPFFKTPEMGSFVYAKQAKEKKKKIKAAVILEMIGYYSNQPFSQKYPPLLGLFFPNRANFIAIVGNLTNRKLANKIHSAFKEHSDFPAESVVLFNFVPGLEFSDHWSFWQHGFPAVMITDTAFYRYRHYHLPSDTFEKLDYNSMAAVTEGLKEALLKLAN